MICGRIAALLDPVAVAVRAIEMAAASDNSMDKWNQYIDKSACYRCRADRNHCCNAFETYGSPRGHYHKME